MAIGLGMALYSLGKYDDAVKSLLRAADLDPSDPRGYPFLSRAFDSSPSQAEEVIVRLEEKDKAQIVFELYREHRAEHLSDLDKQRAEIRQFVYSEQQGNEAKP